MSIRMAPKLKDKHIILPPFSATRVNLAAQVLSHSVAAGINTLCALKHLPDEASAAAEFIETFDQLFNAFNSARLNSSHKYKNALSESSGHFPFLISCLRISCNAENNMKCSCSMCSWLANFYHWFVRSLERFA